MLLFDYNWLVNVNIGCFILYNCIYLTLMLVKHVEKEIVILEFYGIGHVGLHHVDGRMW